MRDDPRAAAYISSDGAQDGYRRRAKRAYLSVAGRAHAREPTNADRISAKSAINDAHVRSHVRGHDHVRGYA